jgi:hypothetical protein
MNAAALSPSLAERLEWLVEGLCKVFGAQAHKRGVEAALAWAVWNRVRVLGERLIALAERARSGRLRARAVRRDTSPRPSPQSGEGEVHEVGGPTRAASVLPREFGWIRGLVPETAQFAGVLSWLLRDPEMAALVGKTPQAGRILRPLCHLLGVKAPVFLRRGYVPADPPPHLAPGSVPGGSGPGTGAGLPPPGAERNDQGDAGAAEASVAAEPALPAAAPVAAEMPALPSPPPVPHHLRPGGLYWNGRRWAWA